MSYSKFSDWLAARYGGKVYKLPVNLPASCPNRDGKKGTGGCIFCGEEGAGFECLESVIPVSEQLLQNAAYIGKKYKADKFIAYFQNYSNTYLPWEIFVKSVEASAQSGVVALYLSTRPDCIEDRHLEFLRTWSDKTGLDVVIELGLQTSNNDTLKILNRGHSAEDFEDAVMRIHASGFGVCTHLITDLPWDTLHDLEKTADMLNRLNIEQIKLHALYILKNTVLGEMYIRGEVNPLGAEALIERTIFLLERLSPEIQIQRLLGRAPESLTLYCNDGKSWWKIRDEIESRMQRDLRYQGKNIRTSGEI